MAVLMIGLAGGFSAQAALQPVNLRCEHRVNPLGIGDAAPMLSWQLQSDAQGTTGRGEAQSAYQIQVGTTPGAADVWDSGKVASDRTFDVAYGGRTLQSGEALYWRARVFDGADTASAWSPAARWSMGLLDATDWTAQWIGYDEAYNLTPRQSAENALFNTSGLSWIRFPAGQSQAGLGQTLLRKQIALPSNQTITNAAFALYADNTCGVYVDGRPMTNLVTRWEATTRVPVTQWLHPGMNLVALGVTNSDAQQWASAIGRLVVQFSSGTVSNIPVDTSWKSAQQAPPAWAQTNYNDSAWITPESQGSPWGTPAINDLARVPAAYLRKSFSVAQSIKRATVYVTALGAYELRINGEKVGDDVLTPGWTDFNKRVYYQTYDVTTLLRTGANAIGAILGDGWYASDLAFRGSRKNYGGNPRLMAQLVIEHSDGSRETVASDASWKASYGPILFGDLLMGSAYDARREMPGWDTTNFNDSAWSPVLTGMSTGAAGYADVTAIVAGYVSNNTLNFAANNSNLVGDPIYGVAKTLQITYQLGSTTRTQSFAENTTVNIGGAGQTLSIIKAYYGRASSFPGAGGTFVQAAVTEPSRCMETLPALSVTEPKPGVYTFDLGQNMVGWVRLKISGSIGDRITVRHGEMLNPDGTVYTANLRGANSADFYTFGTNGKAVYEPRFTFHGFRYVELRGLKTPPTVASVTGIVVQSDMPRTGDFKCSDPLVNQLFSNIIWGQKGNYLEVPTDCPQRDERLGWTGDTEFFAPTAAYNFDVQTFFSRHLVTLCEDSQSADGSYANVAPDLGAGGSAAAWGDASWICTRVMYQAYADTNVVADHYAALQHYGQFLASHASNYVINSLPGDFGDWLNLGGGASSKVIDTAYYAYYAQAMSEMAAAIGRTSDAASYAALRENIAAAFAAFFNSDGSFSDGGSQTAYALAFTLGLVPANLSAQAAQKFEASLDKFDDHLATGFIGTPRLLPALHSIGRDDLAYQVLLQKTYPSWLYQVTLGATTMWERWDGWTPGNGFQSIIMNSFNHYSFGAVGEYLYGVVGGIQPASPGYKQILIQPVPGPGLTWAKTSYDSARGTISTAWTNANNRFDLEVTVPPNTIAEIHVPTTNAAAILESGMPVAGAPGVALIANSNNAAVYSVGSGRYQFSSPYPTTLAPGMYIDIATTNLLGTGGGTFTPNWQFTTNGSLIAGRQPSSSTGNFSEEVPGRNVSSLTDGGNFGLTRIAGTSGNTASKNYVTCGNGNGAGSTVVYALPGSTNGYSVTNITVYGGWVDAGRDQQAYVVYYSTTADPNDFIKLTGVNYNPPNPGDVQSATRVVITSTTGALATNVAAVKFDFTSPGSENGFCGYNEIAIYGVPGLLPTPPAKLKASLSTDASGFVMAASGLLPGRSYELQSKTNLSTGGWSLETNFIAWQTVLALTNPMAESSSKFFRLVGK